MDRKGITPLISTFFLISFAIGLGALVMSWGNSTTLKLSDCSHVALAITELNSVPQFCLSADSVKVTVENNGNQEIVSIELVFLTEDSSVALEVPVSVKPGHYSYLTVPLPTQENILKVRMIPYADKKCVDKIVEIDSLRAC
jgi:hypothetical protein